MSQEWITMIIEHQTPHNSKSQIMEELTMGKHGS
jgi:hypothetical protein